MKKEFLAAMIAIVAVAHGVSHAQSTSAYPHNMQVVALHPGQGNDLSTALQNHKAFAIGFHTKEDAETFATKAGISHPVILKKGPFDYKLILDGSSS